MTTESALPDLRARLAQAGFDEERPDLPVLWAVLREWVAVPVERMDPARDADMLLFECSLDLHPADRYSPGPRFTVGFTRQFSFEDDAGEYLGMEHLAVDLSYEVHDDFRAITRMTARGTFGTADLFWGAGGPRSAEWARRVEASRSYGTALAHAPRDVRLHQGPV